MVPVLSGDSESDTLDNAIKSIPTWALDPPENSDKMFYVVAIGQNKNLYQADSYAYMKAKEKAQKMVSSEITPMVENDKTTEHVQLETLSNQIRSEADDYFTREIDNFNVYNYIKEKITIVENGIYHVFILLEVPKSIEDK